MTVLAATAGGAAIGGVLGGKGGPTIVGGAGKVSGQLKRLVLLVQPIRDIKSLNQWMTLDTV